jgi:hypothetical protein
MIRDRYKRRGRCRHCRKRVVEDLMTGYMKHWSFWSLYPYSQCKGMSTWATPEGY